MLRDIKCNFAQENPFRYGIAPNVFALHASRAYGTVELCKHRAHAPLLLAEKLRRGQSAINERSSFKYRDLLHDRSNGTFIGGVLRCIIIYLYSYSKCTDNIYATVISCLIFSHKLRHFKVINLRRVSNPLDMYTSHSGRSPQGQIYSFIYMHSVYCI